MSKPDTNQASKDALEQHLLNDKAFQHILKFAPESQRELMTFELARYIDALIRTEKLKAQIDILQEGVSESKEFCGEDVDINLGWVNFKLNKLQQSLTKLEAEL